MYWDYIITVHVYNILLGIYIYIYILHEGTTFIYTEYLFNTYRVWNDVVMFPVTRSVQEGVHPLSCTFSPLAWMPTFLAQYVYMGLIQISP